jgi:peptidoglycan/xylan/chitin deacetylase (PgdA/CDA1 family)
MLMDKKTYRSNRKKPKLKLSFILLIWVVLLCMGLGAVCVYEGTALNSVSASLSKLKKQNSELQSQVQEQNQKYKTLQDNYNALNSAKTAAKGQTKTAYLTFDDGPSKLTAKLLDTLKANGVHATFFIIGVNAQKNPDALNQIINGGNVIGIHSWTHQYSYIYASTANFLEDFNKEKDYIKQVTGVEPKVCRFPGGTNNTVSYSYDKHIMQQIVPLVTGMGIKPFDWNVDSEDAPAVVPSKDQIYKTVMSECKLHTNNVILFHDAEQHESIYN